MLYDVTGQLIRPGDHILYALHAGRSSARLEWGLIREVLEEKKALRVYAIDTHSWEDDHPAIPYVYNRLPSLYHYPLFYHPRRSITWSDLSRIIVVPPERVPPYVYRYLHTLMPSTMLADGRSHGEVYPERQ